MAWSRSESGEMRQRWPNNVDPMGTTFESTLNPFWANFGPTLGQLQKHFGPIFDRRCRALRISFELILGKLGTVLGMTLGHKSAFEDGPRT